MTRKADPHGSGATEPHPETGPLSPEQADGLLKRLRVLAEHERTSTHRWRPPRSDSDHDQASELPDSRP